MLFLGGRALTERGLRAASRVAAATGARLLAETFPARMERGAGLPSVDRLAYLAESAGAQLAGVTDLVLAGARSPVSFFAYPGQASDLVPAGCAVTTLADREQDVEGALEELADLVAAGTAPVLAEPGIPPAEPGPLNAISLANTIAASLPEHVIIADEANTSGFALPTALAGAPRHTLLTLTGGSIGQGMPAATGAAVAAQCHDRADQQRRLRDPADGTGPHRGRPGRRAGRADARPVRPHPGFHPAQPGARRAREPCQHGR
jgi:acetolactate synthase-1/2/3 large subunit